MLKIELEVETNKEIEITKYVFPPRLLTNSNTLKKAIRYMKYIIGMIETENIQGSFSLLFPKKIKHPIDKNDLITSKGKISSILPALDSNDLTVSKQIILTILVFTL